MLAVASLMPSKCFSLRKCESKHLSNISQSPRIITFLYESLFNCWTTFNGELVGAIAEILWNHRMPSLIFKDHSIPSFPVGDFQETSAICHFLSSSLAKLFGIKLCLEDEAQGFIYSLQQIWLKIRVVFGLKEIILSLST